MKTKTMKMSIDVLMLFIMLSLMAYSRIGEAVHEILGILLFCLWLGHQFMNWQWYQSIAERKSVDELRLEFDKKKEIT